MDSGRQSSQRTSSMSSLSGVSSGIGNISARQSLSASFGLPSTLNTSESALENPPKVPLRRLAYLNKPEAPVLILGALSAIINGAIMPVFGMYISSMIKTFFDTPHELRKGSKFWALMFVALGSASLVAYPATAYLLGVAGNRLIRRIRLMCFEKLVNTEVGWFDAPERSSGAIGARLSADAAYVRALVGDALAQIVRDSSSAVVGMVIAFEASWQLALIVLCMVPLIGLRGYVEMKFVRGFSADAKV